MKHWKWHNHDFCRACTALFVYFVMCRCVDLLKDMFMMKWYPSSVSLVVLVCPLIFRKNNQMSFLAYFDIPKPVTCMLQGVSCNGQCKSKSVQISWSCSQIVLESCAFTAAEEIKFVFMNSTTTTSLCHPSSVCSVLQLVSRYEPG